MMKTREFKINNLPNPKKSIKDNLLKNKQTT